MATDRPAVTGVYFYGFLQTFRPKDGLIRQVGTSLLEYFVRANGLL